VLLGWLVVVVLLLPEAACAVVVMMMVTLVGGGGGGGAVVAVVVVVVTVVVVVVVVVLLLLLMMITPTYHPTLHTHRHTLHRRTARSQHAHSTARSQHHSTACSKHDTLKARHARRGTLGTVRIARQIVRQTANTDDNADTTRRETTRRRASRRYQYTRSFGGEIDGMRFVHLCARALHRGSTWGRHKHNVNEDVNNDMC